MRRILVPSIFLLLTGLLPALAEAEQPKKSLQELSLPDLERQLDEIDHELEQLANYTLRAGTGSVGYRSKTHQQPDAKEWIQIELGEEILIDEVVLVPTLWRESKVGLVAEGFPQAFQIVLGTDDGGQVVASRSLDDNVFPRIAPLVVDFTPKKASWVRIEATYLSPRIMDGKHMLQLAEVMVFSGKENVALRKTVKVSGSPIKNWAPELLTDGFGPYLMDAAIGERSQTEYMWVKAIEPPPTLTIDLEAIYPVNQINLHTADIGLSIPMIQFADRGVPRHIRVTGACHSDFRDESLLYEYKQSSIYTNGPIMMHRFLETQCRYIRLVIVDPESVVSRKSDKLKIAFSEIEVLSKSRNVAKGAKVIASSGLDYGDGALDKLTDGHNYYGMILPIRDWMNQLAQRHDLETVRPMVVAELNVRYARQKTNLNRLSWLAIFILFGSALAFMITRFLHLRQLTQTKERFAADLHDELGANLHTIGLLSDLAEESKSDPSELSEYLQRIRGITERSGIAVQNVTSLHESRDLATGLNIDLRRAAERIVANLEHDFMIEGENHLSRLSQRASIDLFLFYKECLINICRHSGATQLHTQLTATPSAISLIISDNGRGIPETLLGGVPRSLKRRAQLLKAKLNVQNLAEGGTRITLHFRSRNRKLLFIPPFLHGGMLADDKNSADKPKP